MSRLVTRDRWRQLEHILDRVLDCTPEERGVFLADLDEETRRQVDELIRRGESASMFLDTAAVAQFADLIVALEPPPAILAGRYAIDRLIGRGGMAAVFLARDLRHDRPVAVKVLGTRLSAVVARERFLAEIHIAARLTHPHILAVHDSGETDGHIFFVMPYVDGETLRDRLRREHTLPLHDAVKLTEEIAGALVYAHQRGVIHRDVKPENVLIESGHAVVADFGIARALDVAVTHPSSAGAATGTPWYMSPEQAAGGPIDARSDLYSVGCVLFEMLAGQPPFNGPDVEQVLRQHQTSDAPLLAHTRPDVPRTTDETIRRALAKRPEDRFSDLTEFVHSLQASVSTPESAESGGLPQRRQFARLTPRRIGAGVVLMSAATIATIALRYDRSIEAANAKQPATVAYTSGRLAVAAPKGAILSRNPGADSAYLLGRYHLERRTAHDRKRAVVEFTRATELDPDFAVAYARLAEAYANLAYFGYVGGPPAAEAFAKADSALAWAIARDSSTVEVSLSLAKLRWMHSPDLNAAERAIHEAIARDSSLAEVRFEHGRILALRGHGDSAIAEIESSLRLDPGSSARRADVAWILWIVRRYRDAEARARADLSIDPASSTAYLALGGALIGQRRYDEAITAFERGWEQSGGNQLFLPQLGHAYACAGRTTDAMKILNELRNLRTRGLTNPYYLAQVHLGLEQPDSALHWLEIAQRERAGHLAFLGANAVWDPLRNTPRFQSLVRAVGVD